MNNIDKNGHLKDSPFDYQITKNNKMILFYENKKIMILGEKESRKIIQKMNNKSEFEIQMILAKATGNFKRGNEKQQKHF
jgi:hypothetical protein